MKVAKDKVVYIYYTLREDQGQVLGSNLGDEALAYLHGHGNLIRGLEQALEGRQSGERFEVNVTPKLGYGVLQPGTRGARCPQSPV